MVHLKTTPTFLTQSINKRGRGKSDYVINLNGYGLRLQLAPRIDCQYPCISVLLMRFEEQMTVVTAEYIFLLRKKLPSFMVQKMLCYICCPGTMRILNIEEVGNLVKAAVNAIVVENRRTWDIWD